VQNFAKNKVVAYVEKKIKTKVSIGTLSIAFPKQIVLKNVYFEDQQKDTLLYGKELRIDIALFKLLNHEIDADYIELNGITANIYRIHPDTSFNYDYIVKAFADTTSASQTPDTSAGFKFNLGKIIFKDIRASFRDDYSGNDAKIYLGSFETHIKNFDLEHFTFYISSINVENVKTNIHQYRPFTLNPADTLKKVQATSSSTDAKIKLDEVNLKAIQFDYVNDVSALNAQINIGEFITHPKNIDLQKTAIDINDISLNNTSAKMSFNKTSATVPPSVQSDTAQFSWKVNLAKVNFNSDTILYDDNTQPHQKTGMDYSHLKIQTLNFNAADFALTPTSYEGKIAQASFTEQSGFILKKLQTNFSYNDTSVSLQNLLVQTDKTLLKNKLILKYHSLDDVSKHPGNMYVDADMDHCVLNAKDILIFAPQLSNNLKGNGNAALQLNSSIKGYVKDLSIPVFQLNGLNNTAINISGNIKGLPDGKNAVYDLTIAQLKTSANDIHQLMPASAVPSNIRIPQQLSAHGYFRGSMKQFVTQLQLNSTNGNAFVKANIHGKESYTANIVLDNLNVGYITKQEQNVGKVSLSANATGTGFDMKNAVSGFDADIKSAELNGYNYKSLLFSGNINKGDANLKANMNDTNIRFHLVAAANITQKYPSDLKMELQLDTLNMRALNFTKDTLTLHGNLLADMPQTNPDSLTGKIIFDSLSIVSGQRKFNTDSVSLIADATGAQRNLNIYSEFLKANLSGEYKLTEIGNALQQTINKYYKIPGSQTTVTASENWDLHAVFIPSPLILQLIPGIKGSDSLVLKSSFNSNQNLLNASLKTKRFIYGTNQADSLTMLVNTDNNKLNFDAGFNHAKASGIELYKTSLAGFIIDNKANIDLDVKDAKNKTQYNVAGSLSQIPQGVKFSLAPDSLVLYYDKWNVAANNFIQYDSTGILINNFKIDNSGQSLIINSTPQTVNAPLQIQFNNFQIGTLTKIANQDSLLMDGTINGNAVVKDATTNPVFTSDLQINNFTYKKDTVGNITVKVNNETANAFAADISIEGNKNDIKLNGTYHTGESSMDMKLDVNSLNLASIKPFASGEIQDMDGIIKSNIAISGTIDKPAVTGSLNFENAYIVPAITGEKLKLSNQAINIDAQGLHFNNFTMLDSANNKAVITGDILTTDFKNYKFNADLNATDFTVINTPQESNKLFYGKLNITTKIKLRGDMDSPVADATLKINKQTNFTMILPNEDPEVQDREGIVKFVDKDHPDTATVKTIYDSLGTTEIKGIDVSANIVTDSAAKLALVIDESSGDALTMQGIANLNAGIDKSGKTSLTGTYQLTHGSYQVSLSLLKRNFIIQSGSTITWTGDPTSAQVDINAIYNVNAAPIDLVQQQLGGAAASDVTRYKQNLPFAVNLKLEGDLLKPVITFDITLPQDLLSQWPEVDLKLQQVRTDPSELNKQVFALLLLNRFVQDDPFQSAAGGTSASQLAVQSASKILSDQLNQLAGSLVKGVDINFDINSQQDYSTGVQQNNTDVNVGVSKKLLNDRLVVNVGTDIGLQGAANSYAQSSSLSGNFSVDYKLSQDGKYTIRAYRQNDYEEIIEGQVIETGVSFIITLDFDKFKELFEKSKKTKKNSTPNNSMPQSIPGQ
jgi:hypothetical protein